MSGLELVGFTARVGGRALYGPLDLVVGAGVIATVMGPSGSGKSTLLAHVLGLAAPGLARAGTVHLDGRDLGALPPERRGLGLLFQDALLFPHLNLAQNLGFGLPARWRGGARRERIEAALAAAGLAGMGGRDPATLSGGERARAALMRTLLAEPRAVLLDEPFAALDADTRDRLRAHVFGEIRARGLPALLVTHDPADAEAAGGPVERLS